MKYVFYIALSCLLVGTVYASRKPNSFNKDSLKVLLNRSLYTEALNYYLQSKDSVFKLNDSSKIEWLIEYSNIATSAFKSDLAFESLQQSIELSDKSNLKQLNIKSKIQLIELFRNVRFYDNSLEIIKELEASLPIMKPYDLSRFYHRSAAVYNELQYLDNDNLYLDTAIFYSMQSLKISERENFKNHRATSYNELGNIYERLGDSLNSINYYDKSINLWKDESKFNYANAIKNKGSFFLRNQNYDSAIVYFKKGLKLTDELKDYRFNIETFWGIKQSYYLKGDSLNGLKSELNESKNSVLDAEQRLNNKLFELTTAFESKRKDAQLEKSQLELASEKKHQRAIILVSALLLLLVITLSVFMLISKKKNKLLKNLLKENEFLIGESNHRIKNNLQLIISLIGREIYKSDSAKQELQGISEKINSIAALHQQLYINESKKSISVKDYLRSIESNFKSGLIQENVLLTLEVDDFDMPVDKSVYLGLLVTELIINSIKHAFVNSKNKVIKISAWKANDSSIHLNYQDNGAGLKVGQSPSLVNLLLKQLKASITLNNTIGYSLNIKFNK